MLWFACRCSWRCHTWRWNILIAEKSLLSAHCATQVTLRAFHFFYSEVCFRNMNKFLIVFSNSRKCSWQVVQGVLMMYACWLCGKTDYVLFITSGWVWLWLWGGGSFSFVKGVFFWNRCHIFTKRGHFRAFFGFKHAKAPILREVNWQKPQ